MIIDREELRDKRREKSEKVGETIEKRGVKRLGWEWV